MKKKSNNLIAFFSNSDWSKNFDKNNFFLADFDNTTNVNRIFLASVFSDLSIRMRKNWNTWISFFLNSDWWKNFYKKSIFLADFDNSTKVNRIFLASVFIGFSIPMRKKSNNLIAFFSNFDWSKNFEEKIIFLADFVNTTNVNWIFLASVVIDLSIAMLKKSYNLIAFFSNFDWWKNFYKKRIFLADFDNTAKVISTFLVSVFTGHSNGTSKKSNNWIWFFREFWLIEKFRENKKKFFSREFRQYNIGQ